ncbi:putative extracellular endoglucanase/cellulase [Aspergillus chevalieri]|uniref:cellulase n=1 Tax=Aspergillus chevalieri TaxID=182096 RepID=A0A7R7VQ99_ASPCH|nr:uncharacterized protein ACHE_40697S [Aspergillus chevalieri]BCR88133.1 hypothetical protein ACHE_40697S [Aspergillus chevalieri]
MRFTSLMMAASAMGLVHAATKRDASAKKSGFTWVGANESGAEFGEDNIPGKLDKDYTFPNTTAIQTLRDSGMNIFRVPFLMERLVPDDMTGGVNAAYLKDLRKTIQFITESGAYAVLDPHNYGRYSGNIITNTDNFKAFWKTVAGEFSSNEKVIFDTNNEYHDMDQSLVLNLNQAAINGIRSAGAKNQYIFIEGNAYTGAWKWTDNNDNLKSLTDPQDKLVYQMHQYLDSDGSGTSETCVSDTIGKERLQSATQWLKKNSKKGFVGEFAGGVNEQCEKAVEGMLEYMNENSDVWMGAEWWAAGPWWGDYMYNLEPTDGQAYGAYLPILKKYFPSEAGASLSASSSTSTKAVRVPLVRPSSSGSGSVSASASASASASPSGKPSGGALPPTIPVFVPTTFATVASATPSSLIASSTSSVVPSASSSGGVANKYGQCGGITWTGPKTCESGSSCIKQNAYYSQCQ